MIVKLLFALDSCCNLAWVTAGDDLSGLFHCVEAPLKYANR